jgi:hypothetical protein
MYYIYGLYKKNAKYTTDRLVENLFYIGITEEGKNFYHRIKNHKIEKSNPYKLNIIAKYDFNIKILWSVSTRNEAEDREEFLIRWFGKTFDKTGILTNITSGAKDTTYIRKNRTELTNKRISTALKKINENQKYRTNNRDRNLTIPYNIIILLIEEWASNPLETQQNFAKRKQISRSKFKDWLRLYKPEYIGLTKKRQKELFLAIDQTNKKPSEIIKEFAKISGYSENKAKGVYYRLVNKKMEK